MTFLQAAIEEREERKKQEALLAAEREKDAKQREAEEQRKVYYMNYLYMKIDYFLAFVICNVKFARKRLLSFFF